MKNEFLLPFDENTVELKLPNIKKKSKKPSKLDSFSPSFKKPKTGEKLRAFLWYGLVLSLTSFVALNLSGQLRSTISMFRVHNTAPAAGSVDAPETWTPERMERWKPPRRALATKRLNSRSTKKNK